MEKLPRRLLIPERKDEILALIAGCKEMVWVASEWFRGYPSPTFPANLIVLPEGKRMVCGKLPTPPEKEDGYFKYYIYIPPHDSLYPPNTLLEFKLPPSIVKKLPFAKRFSKKALRTSIGLTFMGDTFYLYGHTKKSEPVTLVLYPKERLTGPAAVLHFAPCRGHILAHPSVLNPLFQTPPYTYANEDHPFLPMFECLSDPADPSDKQASITETRNGINLRQLAYLLELLQVTDWSSDPYNDARI